MSYHNPLKRRRVDSDSQVARSVRQESPDTHILQSDVSFSDGNIVLQAENVQFKVHQSVIATHSPIFADVFSMPHPDSEPTVDGCPLVHLYDSAVDVRHMIRAIYGAGNYFSKRGPLSFEELAALVRMGRKYDISRFREEAMDRLTLEFPQSKVPIYLMCPGKQRKWKEFVHDDGLLFDIANLAYDCNIEKASPFIYFLCTLDLTELLMGTRRTDGSMVQLSYEVQRICILGRERVLSSQEHQWVDSIGSLFIGCRQPIDYSIGSILINKALRRMPLSPARSFLHEKALADWLSRQWGICDACTGFSALSYSKERSKTWMNLPTYFGLPPWHELSDFGAK